MKIVNLIENLIIDLNYYKCLLIDGVWGIGKTYAVNKFIEENKKYNCCYLSLYGKTDIEEIKSDVYKKINKDKNNTVNILMFIGIVFWAISQIIPTELFVEFFSIRLRCYYGVKILLTAIAIFIGIYYTKENISKHFNTLRKAKKNEIIIFDDIERINEKLSLNELFSYIEVLKKLNYKVVLITNGNEIMDNEKDYFKKHLEKVVDRKYDILENDVDIATKLLLSGFNEKFEGEIKEFIKKHNIKNLRTIEKASFLIKEILDIENKVNDDEDYLEIDSNMFKIIIIISISICVEFYDNIYEAKYQKQSEEQKRDNGDGFYSALRNLYLSDNPLLEKVNKYYLEHIKTTNKNKIVNAVYDIFTGTNKKEGLEILKNELKDNDRKLPMYSLYKSDEAIKSEINEFNLQLKNKQFNNFNEIIEKLRSLYSFFNIFDIELNKEDLINNIEYFWEYFNNRPVYKNKIIFNFPENEQEVELNQYVSEIAKNLKNEKIVNDLIDTYNKEEYDCSHIDAFLNNLRITTENGMESKKEEIEKLKMILRNNNCFIPNLDKEINDLKWGWIHHLLLTLSDNINGKRILDIAEIKKMIINKMNEELNNATEAIGKYRIDFLINHYKLKNEDIENK